MKISFNKTIMNPLLIFFCAITTTTVIAGESNSKGFEMYGMVLYQPESILMDRLRHDLNPLADYAFKIEEEAKKVFAEGEKLQEGWSGALVIAIKPEKKSCFWMVSNNKLLPADFRKSLLSELSKLDVFEVQKGPVAFAIKFNAWGGGEKPKDKFPIPEVWLKAIEGREDVILPDTPLSTIWPNDCVK